MTPVPRERLIAVVADLLDGVRHVAVGAASPLPAAGAMLLRARCERDGREPVRLSILGSSAHNFFTNGSGELFDCAAQGRIDAFFLGGGQIDGQGNINLVGAGSYPRVDVRWPGSFGSSFLYFAVPRVILFREEHSPRVLVPKVDFISAPGTSPPEVWRRGGPYALLTSKALFDFDRNLPGFRLRSLHPGCGLEEIRSSTGFAFACPANVPTTPDPDGETLGLIRGRVLHDLAETYPGFARELSDDVAATVRP
jgi:glutaconate CoA-transferase subunit B